jgi:hypothetical protein
MTNELLQQDPNCGTPAVAPSEEPTTEVKAKSKALDIADGLLMIIFAFALYAEIYSVFLYAWQ